MFPRDSCIAKIRQPRSTNSRELLNKLAPSFARYYNDLIIAPSFIWSANAYEILTLETPGTTGRIVLIFGAWPCLVVFNVTARDVRDAYGRVSFQFSLLLNEIRKRYIVGQGNFEPFVFERMRLQGKTKRFVIESVEVIEIVADRPASQLEWTSGCEIWTES